MKAILIEFVVLVVLGVAIYGTGHMNGRTKAEAAAASQAHQEYREEVERGQRASAHFIAELADLQDQRLTLEGKFNDLSRRRAPLVAAGAVGASPRLESELSAAGAATTAQGCVVVAAVPEPRLTHGAVWMWNSALVGRDMPSGSCGSDDTSEGSCDAATAVTLDDAWHNHAANAKACAEDRLRHQHLIDYLEGRKR